MPKILIIGRESESTRFLYTSICTWNRTEDITVIYEKQPNFKSKIKRIIGFFGILKAIDVILFIILGTILSRLYIKKRREIFEHLNYKKITNLLYRIENVNSKDSITLIKTIDPKIILLSGCRILSCNTIGSLAKYEILNIHAGITPYYRGVHGAYWSLVHNERPGVTLHRVDKGVDTGEIITQNHIEISARDSFWTYPAIQLKTGVELLKDYIVYNKLGNRIYLNRKSKQFRHPRLSTYLKNLVLKKIK